MHLICNKICRKYARICMNMHRCILCIFGIYICKPNRFNIVDNTQQYPLYCNYQYNMNNITISTISIYVLSTIFPTIHKTIRSFVLFCVSQNVQYGIVLPAIISETPTMFWHVMPCNKHVMAYTNCCYMALHALHTITCLISYYMQLHAITCRSYPHYMLLHAYVMTCNDQILSCNYMQLHDRVITCNCM